MKRLIAGVALALAVWAGAKAQPKLKRAALHRVSSAAVAAVRITKAPTVEYVSTHHAVISWETDVNSGTMLKYGTSRDRLDAAQHGKNGKAHRIELSHLKADTTYYFQAISGVAPGTAAQSEIGIFDTHERGHRPTRYPQQR